MKKRKLFFIKGNFQLKFILCFVVVLAMGIFLATFLIYRSLQGVVEEAAFSSHLSLRSSGELFWHAILQINLLIASISVLIGFLIITCVHLYLESFFHSLSKGLDRLARGDFSFRLKLKSKWWVRQPVDDFNTTAMALNKNSEEIKTLLDSALEVLNSHPQEMGKEMKSIHERLRQAKCP